MNRFRDDRRSASGRAQLVQLDTIAEPMSFGGQQTHLILREVHDAMGRLPLDQRAALLLVALEGMNLAEAARVLEIPEGTLASRLARARATLRVMTGRDSADGMADRR